MLATIKQLHYKELFLYGSLFSYIAGMILTAILGTTTHNTLTVIFALASGTIILIVTFYYKRHKNYITTSLILLWNSVIFVSFRIVMYGYSLDIAFLLIPPMVAAILLDKKNLLLFSLLYILFTVGLLRYGYVTCPGHPFLHDKKLVLTFGIFSFFVVMFGFIYHYSIEQSYERLETSDKQKTFLLKEVHHRVKNNLNMMTSILGLQTYKHTSPQMQEFIKQNTLRINSIALVHELLYQDDDIENIHLPTYIDKLAKHIIAISKNEKILLKINVEEIQLNINDIIHLGIILNELITNSIKYAFDGHEESICIRLERMDNQYFLQYNDNGKGMQENTVNQNGFGLSLINLSVEHLQGQWSTSNAEGFSCHIYFKGTQL
jgi:two-component sensor histidine kinase